MSVDKSAFIDTRVMLLGSGKVVVGSNCSLVGDSRIDVEAFESRVVFDSQVQVRDGARIICRGKGRIKIGSNCFIGEGTVMVCDDMAQIEIADHVRIESGVQIISKSDVTIGSGTIIGTATSIAPRENFLAGRFVCGKNCHIHQYNFIDTTACVILGNDVRTGPYDVFYTHDHSLDGTESIWDQPVKRANIVIGAGAWIGAHATILMGIQIDDGAVVGAGSVVTKSLQAYEVVGGVPAKKIRNRTDAE